MRAIPSRYFCTQAQNGAMIGVDWSRTKGTLGGDSRGMLN